MINYIGTKKIETERLILRRFRVEDAQNVYDNYGTTGSPFLSWFAHKNVEETKELLTNWVKEYEKVDYFNWAIVLKENNEVIGGISLVGFDDKFSRCEIGYCLGNEFSSKGYMTEALKGVIKYCSEEAGFTRIQAKHDINNPASGKVMQKAGMNFEGTLKKFHLDREGYLVDVNMYSVVKEDI